MFFLKIVLAIWDLLCFQRNFKVICSRSVEKAIDILIAITLNLQIVLGSVVILTILILPIYENDTYFHLFGNSSIPFINILIVFQVHEKTNGLGSLSVFRSRQDCFSKGVSSGRDLRWLHPSWTECWCAGGAGRTGESYVSRCSPLPPPEAKTHCGLSPFSEPGSRQLRLASHHSTGSLLLVPQIDIC